MYLYVATTCKFRVHFLEFGRIYVSFFVVVGFFFFYCFFFSTQSRIFHSYEDDKITDEGQKINAYIRYSSQYKQWGFFNVSQLLWHGTFVYNSSPATVTFLPIIERLTLRSFAMWAQDISQYVVKIDQHSLLYGLNHDLAVRSKIYILEVKKNNEKNIYWRIPFSAIAHLQKAPIPQEFEVSSINRAKIPKK